ncbi:MAG: T9SS type A sorting domain-containing protein [Bacteroidota bacterium]
MNQHLGLVYFVLLVVTAVVGRVEAQNVVMPWSAFHAGGGRASAPELLHAAAYGQAVVGRAVAGNTVLESGFLATRILLGPITEIPEQPSSGLPTEFSLSQNYPNPFNPSTTIRYGLPRTSFVTLTVYNALGQQVAQLVNEQQQTGYHDVVFRGDHLASGVYFYRLQADDFVASKKLLFLK